MFYFCDITSVLRDFSQRDLPTVSRAIRGKNNQLFWYFQCFFLTRFLVKIPDSIQCSEGIIEWRIDSLFYELKTLYPPENEKWKKLITLHCPWLEQTNQGVLSGVISDLIWIELNAPDNAGFNKFFRLQTSTLYKCPAFFYNFFLRRTVWRDGRAVIAQGIPVRK